MNKIYLGNIIDLLWNVVEDKKDLNVGESIIVYDDDNERYVKFSNENGKLIVDFEVIKIENVTNMEDLHCYGYYEEIEDYSERDEVKKLVQKHIENNSESYEYKNDYMTFKIHNSEYIFQICDEFVNMSMSKENKLLFTTKNPNIIIEYITSEVEK